MLGTTKWFWAVLLIGVFAGSSGCLFDWTVPGESGGAGGTGGGTPLEVTCPEFGSCNCPAGKTCTLTCLSGSCSITCGDASNCEVTCTEASCNITCSPDAACNVNCANSLCTMSCDPSAANCSCTPDVNCN